MSLIQVTKYWRQASVRGAVADFRTVFEQSQPHRWKITIASALATTAIFATMWQEEVRGPPPRPKITYITTFRPDRTDAEIVASNIENQKQNDAIAAAEAARAERIRQMYKTLGRLSGMDVDAIDQRANADRKSAGLAPLPGSKNDPAGE